MRNHSAYTFILVPARANDPRCWHKDGSSRLENELKSIEL